MKKIVFIFTLMYALSACNDLSIDPNSKLTDQTAYKSKYEFMYGLSGVYSSLAVWSEIVFKGGASSDEMIFPARGADWKGDLQSFQDHTWKPANDELDGLYRNISNIIAVSNSFIETIDKSQFKDDANIQVIRTETRYVRAFAYFLMIDFFGNVPLVTSAVYDAKNPPTQNTRAEIYDFVEKELRELSTTLPAKNDYGRVDRYAAKTLLAKLYLNADVYLGGENNKWQDVVSLTGEVIDGGNYLLENNYKDVFRWDNDRSKELIFALVCDSKNTTAENISYLFSLTDLREKYGSFADGWDGAATLPSFYKSYDENDLRRLAFLAGPQVDAKGKPIIAKDDKGVERQLTYHVDFIGADPVYNADHWDGARGVKYLMDGIGGTMVRRGLNNDMPILRYADVLLMRAEALYRINPADAEALALINKVRTRNGNNPIAPLQKLTGDEILAERGREFAWEGWRRNDQIRFGKWGNAWDYKPMSDAKYKLFPIPQKQIDSNRNLKQNSGY